jgi:hypothetical protein
VAEEALQPVDDSDLDSRVHETDSMNTISSSDIYTVDPDPHPGASASALFLVQILHALFLIIVSMS